MKVSFLVLAAVFVSAVGVSAQSTPIDIEEIEDTRDKRMQEGSNFYCGLDNCYEVIGDEMIATFPSDEYPGGKGEKPEGDEEEAEVFEKVNREASAAVIDAACEALKDEYDPDENPDPTAKPIFLRVNAACAALQGEKRADYEYYLDHPEERWTAEPGFARTNFKAKSNIFLVTGVVIVLACLMDWKMQEARYSDAKGKFRKQFQQKIEALALEKKGGAAATPSKVTHRRNKGSAKKGDKKSKRLSEEELNTACTEMFEKELAVTGNTVLSAPQFPGDLLVVKVVSWPLWFFNMAKGFATQDKAFLVRWNLNITSASWAEMDEADQQELIDQGWWDFSITEAEKRAEQEKRAKKDKKKKR